MSEFLKDDLYYTTGPDFDINDPSNFAFNGNQIRLGTYSYDTNQMTFVWDSDSSICSNGFNITYSIASNPCINNLCLNGATCRPYGISYTCECTVLYSGEFCGQGNVNVLIAALGGLAVFTALITLILIISCAKARKPSSATNQLNVSDPLFLVGVAMERLQNVLRRRLATDLDAVADVPNDPMAEVDRDQENRGQENGNQENRNQENRDQENRGQENNPPTGLGHWYESWIVRSRRTRSNPERQRRASDHTNI